MEQMNFIAWSKMYSNGKTMHFENKNPHSHWLKQENNWKIWNNVFQYTSQRKHGIHLFRTETPPISWNGGIIKWMTTVLRRLYFFMANAHSKCNIRPANNNCFDRHFFVYHPKMIVSARLRRSHTSVYLQTVGWVWVWRNGKQTKRVLFIFPSQSFWVVVHSMLII